MPHLRTRITLLVHWWFHSFLSPLPLWFWWPIRTPISASWSGDFVRQIRTPFPPPLRGASCTIRHQSMLPLNCRTQTRVIVWRKRLRPTNLVPIPARGVKWREGRFSEIGEEFLFERSHRWSVVPVVIRVTVETARVALVRNFGDDRRLKTWNHKKVNVILSKFKTKVTVIFLKLQVHR